MRQNEVRFISECKYLLSILKTRHEKQCRITFKQRCTIRIQDLINNVMENELVKQQNDGQPKFPNSSSNQLFA